MLPINKTGDAKIFRNEDVVGLEVRMAKNRQIELRTCRYKMGSEPDVIHQ